MDFFRDFVLTRFDDWTLSIHGVLDAVGLGTIMHKTIYQTVTQGFKSVFKLVYGLKVEGRTLVPLQEPAIICTKNSSGLYPFLAWIAVAEATPRMLHQTFDRDFYAKPILRSLLQIMRGIPVMDGRIDTHCKERLKEKLLDKEIVGMTLENEVQEGEEEQARTIIKDFTILDLANEMNVPIIPVNIPGIEDALDIKSEKFSVNKKVSIKICEPFTPTGNHERDHARLMEIITSED
ncbi:MAG: hypothetical protein ACFFCS_11095 [Candidatus Hodarchaeota archaeon]